MTLASIVCLFVCYCKLSSLHNTALLHLTAAAVRNRRVIGVRVLLLLLLLMLRLMIPDGDWLRGNGRAAEGVTYGSDVVGSRLAVIGLGRRDVVAAAGAQQQHLVGAVQFGGEAAPEDWFYAQIVPIDPRKSSSQVCVREVEGILIFRLVAASRRYHVAPRCSGHLYSPLVFQSSMLVSLSSPIRHSSM